MEGQRKRERKRGWVGQQHTLPHVSKKLQKSLVALHGPHFKPDSRDGVRRGEREWVDVAYLQAV